MHKYSEFFKIYVVLLGYILFSSTHILFGTLVFVNSVHRLAFPPFINLEFDFYIRFLRPRSFLIAACFLIRYTGNGEKYNTVYEFTKVF